MPIEQIVKSICNYKQAYTQYGGLRPFGTAFLFAGWDKNFGFQLYQTDPSGNYSGWKATVIGKFDMYSAAGSATHTHWWTSVVPCVGQNNQAGKSILKTDYSENNTISQNLKIAVKILTKTMDSTTPSPERIELSVLRKEEDGSLVHHTLAAAEIQVLLDQIQKEIEEEQKKAEATTGDL